MRLLHTNDWHLWHLTPSSRLDSWPDTIFRKLDQVAEIARLKNVDAICVAGDIFHSVNVSYAVVTRLIEWAKAQREDDIPVFAIAGNHDERFNRRDSIPTTPLGAIFASGAFDDVGYRWGHFVNPGAVIGMPWPDAKDLALWAQLRYPDDRSGKPKAVMAHCFASKVGGQYFGQPVMSYAALAPLPFDVFHFGHDHSARASMKLDGKLFLNFGALGRGSLAAEELERTVYVAISEATSTGAEGEFVKLHVEPAATVFDLQRYAFEKSFEQRFSEGLGQKIAADFLELAENTTLGQRVMELDVADDIKTRIQQYLTLAEEQVA